MITLYHLAISHYNEKARWAFDLKKMPHERHALVPVLHRLLAPRIAGGRTLPALVDTETGMRLGESSKILQYLDKRWPEPCLYPADEAGRARVLEIERYLDEHAGPSVRAFSYFYLVDFPRALRVRWEMDLSAGQRRLLGLAMPLFRRIPRRAFKLTPENTARRREKIRHVCDRVEAWLDESGSGHLHGDTFTAADLTGASLLGPLGRPEGSPWVVIQGSGKGMEPGYPPAAMEEFLQEFEQREAGRWVHEIWRRYRS